jgi:hypothetical protein
VKKQPGKAIMALEGQMSRFHQPLFPGRKVLEGGETYQLRDPQVSYPDVFGAKNADIDAENSYFWNINPDISR